MEKNKSIWVMYEKTEIDHENEYDFQTICVCGKALFRQSQEGKGSYYL